MSIDRPAYTAGLRALADALDANDALPLPYTGTSAPLSIFVGSKADVVAYARVLDGKVDKKVTDDGNYDFQLHGALRGLQVVVYAHREEVCERRVVGTREVTRTVEVPVTTRQETVVETVEDVEWVCAPLLQQAAVSA